jgi:cobalt/nickel transport system permease protein
LSGQLSLRDFLQVEQSQYQGSSHGWRLWDARLKTALTVLAMALNVLFAKAWLSAGLLGLAAALMAYSRCPLKLVLLFILAPAGATLALVLGMAFGFGVTPLFKLGPLALYREGLLMGLNAGIRVAADVGWAGLLVITTPFTQMLEALRWFRLPRVVVDTLATIYRYVFLLYDEYSAMRNSAQARGGFASFKGSTSTAGLIAAQVFLRSYDRAERVWQAMQARGGEGSDHGL